MRICPMAGCRHTTWPNLSVCFSDDICELMISCIDSGSELRFIAGNMTRRNSDEIVTCLFIFCS